MKIIAASTIFLHYYLNMLLHLGEFAIAGMILYTWEITDISYEHH